METVINPLRHLEFVICCLQSSLWLFLGRSLISFFIVSPRVHAAGQRRRNQRFPCCNDSVYWCGIEGELLHTLGSLLCCKSFGTLSNSEFCIYHYGNHPINFISSSSKDNESVTRENWTRINKWNIWINRNRQGEGEKYTTRKKISNNMEWTCKRQSNINIGLYGNWYKS